MLMMFGANVPDFMCNMWG